MAHGTQKEWLHPREQVCNKCFIQKGIAIGSDTGIKCLKCCKYTFKGINEAMECTHCSMSDSSSS